MFKKVRCLFILLICFNYLANAQVADSVSHVVYFLGNTATSVIPEANLAAFQQELQAQTNSFSVVHLGDITANTGLTRRNKVKTHKQDLLLQLANANPKGNLYLIPGDKDWDNSGPAGLTKVRQLEAYIKQNLPQTQVVVPGNGCPGPEVIDIGSGLRLIAINTQWWMHPYRKPQEPNTDCGILSEQEFMEAFEEAITEAEGRNILVVGHHPIISNGVYGGRIPLKRHIFPLTDLNPNLYLPLPIVGSIYAAYRQNVGTTRDKANPDYQRFTRQMERVLKLNNQVVYAAAHDYSLQLNQTDQNYHLISGSFTEKDFVGRNASSLFNKSAKGFSKLTYYSNGQVNITFYEFKDNNLTQTYNQVLYQSGCAPVSNTTIPVNEHLIPCAPSDSAQTNTAIGLNQTNAPIIKAAGPQYRAKPFKQLFLGKIYRDSWVQPIKVSPLYLSQTPEKLRVFKIGGGTQTTSLRLRAADKREFVFRSVDKDPEEVLAPEYRQTVVSNILRETTPTQQPYAALVVNSLLDSTDILHARPKLYVLGTDPALGQKGAPYEGMLGILEERPTDSTLNKPSFAGSKDIKNSFNFFQQLYRDYNIRVDAKALGKARAFDIFIGDYGRHPGNWRWAAYQTDSQTIYRPIPRDRDQAFGRWDGLLLWTADREWAVGGIQDFDDKLSGLVSMNWPARHLDRFLLTSLNRQDWIDFAQYLQNTFTDEVIDKAIKELPQEIIPIDGLEIGQTLKARRARLPEALHDYYKVLARYVDVVGSNKNEYFKVERLPDAKVRVRYYAKAENSNLPTGSPFFDRTFLKSETKEIRLYGLAGEDVFDVSGEVPASIRIRIIGGVGQDSIRDVSKVVSFRKNTLIYDNTSTKLQLGKESLNYTSDKPNINQYNREAFEYNSYNPSGSLLYNKSDGIGITFGVNYQRRRFRKQDYGSLYSFQVRAAQRNNLQLNSNLLWRQVWGNLDLGAQVDIGRYFRFYNFFGLGNNTVKNEDRFDNNYYVAHYGGVLSNFFVQRQFFQKSYFRIGPLFETFSTDYRNNSLLGEGRETRVNTAAQTLVGARAAFSLDLRDKLIFTQKGFRLYAKHNSYRGLKNKDNRFGITEGFVDYYASTRIFLPFTLALRAGGAHTYGDNLPFFKYPSLGMLQNLRGYVINRFSGDASAYFNSELRLHVGQVHNSFLPFRYGLISFFDQGKVWYKGDDTGGWHEGYGGGFYVSPLAEQFTFSMILQHSVEEKLLFSFGAGFRFDQ